LPMKKWIMKQYWRVGQIRTLTGLATGMLVIGKLYLPYVPLLDQMGLIGAVLLGMTLFSFFLCLGWIYDAKLKMWSQKNQVAVERSAYYYVPYISSKAYDYPLFFVLLTALNSAMKKIGTSTKSLDSIVEYLREYYTLEPTKADINKALEMGKQFIGDHPFVTSSEKSDESIPFSSRIKLAWELQFLRLTWIQSLTGLVQDTLVFGVLYVFIIYPGATADNALYFGIVGISLPLLLILIAFGWIYDRKLKVWAADLAVQVERNPYSYVADPSIFAFTMPFYYAFFNVLYEFLRKNSLETKQIERMLEYLNEYSTLTSSRSQDLNKAVEESKSLGPLFMEET
jgi:hypothetical protein